MAPSEDASSNIEISIEEIASVNNKKSVTWKTDELDAERLVLHESVNNQEFAQLKQLFELSQTSISELKEANAGLAMKLNELAEWSQTNIAKLNETNAVL